MADIGNRTVFSQTDDNNNSGTQPSHPEGQAPNTVNNGVRALQGAVTRDWDYRNFTVTSTGTSTAYVLTYSVAPADYYNGLEFGFIVDEANGTPATVNVNTKGPITVKKVVAGALVDLTANDWLANDRVRISYSTTGPVFVWNNKGATVAAPSGSITTSGYTMTTDRLLGRDTAGTGAIEELTLGGGLNISGGALNVTAGATNVQTFTSSGTWTKPASGTVALLRAWGAGASGGKGRAASAGGGGGGGGYVERWMLVSAMGATETITLNAGGASQTVADSSGNAGGSTTIGALLTAFGGGGGRGTETTGINPGGGGGGWVSAGITPTGTTGGNPGNGLGSPTGTTVNGNGGFALMGRGGDGGGGGAADNGSSGYFEGGGGGGAANDATNTNGNGGASYYGGGGGGAGAEDSAPGPGTGGISLYGGNGGAGAFDANNATAGTAPGGGGGGCETGNSGAGAIGRAEVYVFA
jgi:hypothetical protein